MLFSQKRTNIQNIPNQTQTQTHRWVEEPRCVLPASGPAAGRDSARSTPGRFGRPTLTLGARQAAPRLTSLAAVQYTACRNCVFSCISKCWDRERRPGGKQQQLHKEKCAQTCKDLNCTTQKNSLLAQEEYSSTYLRVSLEHGIAVAR
jgi:hypothetical protein